MSSLLFSVNAVFPLFVIIFFGFAIHRKTGLFDDETRRRMNAVVYKYALPAMLFRDIASLDFRALFDLSLLFYALASTLTIFFASWIIAILFVKDKKAAGVFVQGSFRSNYAILGLPLIANIMGGAGTGKGAVVTTFVVPLYNVLSIVILSVYGSKSGGLKSVVKSSILDIIKNPLIRGIFAGFVISALGISLPPFLTTSVNYMAALTTPLALLSIGASINFGKMREKFKTALAVTSLKLLIWPLVFIPPAVVLGMRGEPLVVLYIMYSSPTAVVSYIMAQSMGGDEHLASDIILLTTGASVLTLTFGIFLLRQLGLI